MANDIGIRTSPIPRNLLFKVFKDPRLVKAFEDFIQDITSTIPNAIGNSDGGAEGALESAEIAQASANYAQTVAMIALEAATEDVGPPAVPSMTTDHLDQIGAELSALRDRVAVLASAVDQLQQGPMP